MSALAVRYGLTRPLRRVESIAEAQAIWNRMRDQAMEQGLGRKDLPVLTVLDLETAEPVVRISWNGRAWRPDGTEHVEGTP